MIAIRRAKDIYQAEGAIEGGTFKGRWHFSFDQYYDPQHNNFGALRVFNDDVLSPGAVWPLHPHREVEVVTYCVEGEFRHADEHGKGGILKQGWAQHTTVGTGMYHSEINNLPDRPMRFIQMWFSPQKHNLTPSVEQKKVKKKDRTDKLLVLVSNEDKGGLGIAADAKIYSCLLRAEKTIAYKFKEDYGGYLYLLEGGPIFIKDEILNNLDAALIKKEPMVLIKAEDNAELLFVVVPL